MSDGLYPSIMVEKPGCKVRVLNYYSETKADREAVLLAKKEASKAVETVTTVALNQTNLLQDSILR